MKKVALLPTPFDESTYITDRYSVLLKLMENELGFTVLRSNSAVVVPSDADVVFKGFVHFVIKTNNYCNLHCEYCTNLCYLPLSRNNENIHRRKKWELSVAELTLFCERFKGIGESTYHHLTGGEVTMMPPRKLEALIDVLASYHRPMSLQTVGYNLLGISECSLNKIDEIVFGWHGINHQQVINSIKYLNKFHYRGRILVPDASYHFDLFPAIKHPSNKGRRCSYWMSVPSLVGSIVFPCCNLPWIMARNNNTVMEDELRKAGWVTHNDKLIDVLTNWRKTVPDYVVHQCENNCWMPNIDVGQGQTMITLKENDLLEKEGQRKGVGIEAV